MKLTFNVHMAGHRHVWEKGQTYPIADLAEAARLVKAGYASTTDDADQKKLDPRVAKLIADEETETAKAARPRAERRGK